MFKTKAIFTAFEIVRLGVGVLRVVIRHQGVCVMSGGTKARYFQAKAGFSTKNQLAAPAINAAAADCINRLNGEMSAWCNMRSFWIGHAYKYRPYEISGSLLNCATKLFWHAARKNSR